MLDGVEIFRAEGVGVAIIRNTWSACTGFERNFKRFASSASARLCLKQVHCFRKQQVGHTGEVLSE